MPRKPTYEELESRISDLEKADYKRKQAEVALRESEERFNRFLRNTPLPYQSLDENGNFLEVNQSLQDLLGYTREELIGRNFGDFLHPDWVDHFKENFPIFKAVGEVLGVEFEIAKKDGTTLLVSLNGKIQRDDQNNFQRTHCIFQDITEQKRAALNLQEAHERLLTILNDLDAGVYVTDMETYKILYANTSVIQGFGDIIGKVCWQSLQRGQSGPCTFCTNKYLLDVNGNPAGSYSWEFQNTITGKWFKISDKAITWVDGRIVRLEIAIDITERKELDEMLKRSHDTLDNRVKERTLELRKTHEQLLHSEKLAAIGGLSASIAHEFNNPLQGVMNVIKGIKHRATMDEEDAQLVDSAINECDRMKALINSLQDFNRPTSGRMAPINIDAAIDSILMLNKNDYQTKGITVETNYADLPQIKAVADQIKQVLLNLLNNAAYACSRGDTITISTDVINKEGIRIKIQDTGKGIKPEHIDKIFDPFFTTKPATKGTGLGLSISYGIIKKHGGRIDVASEPDKGTIFTITLPLA